MPEKFKNRESLPQEPEQESKDENLWLITPEQFENLPDGTELISINGDKVVKGEDYIDQDTRGGYLAFGFPESNKPDNIKFGEHALVDKEFVTKSREAREHVEKLETEITEIMEGRLEAMVDSLFDKLGPNAHKPNVLRMIAEKAKKMALDLESSQETE